MLQANPDLSPQQLKTQMLAAAVDIGAEPNAQGAGRGDAYQSYLKATDENIPEPPPPEPPSEPVPPAQPQPEPQPGCLASVASALGLRK
jgi:hypothetical protein